MGVKDLIRLVPGDSLSITRRTLFGKKEYAEFEVLCIVRHMPPDQDEVVLRRVYK